MSFTCSFEINKTLLGLVSMKADTRHPANNFNITFNSPQKRAFPYIKQTFSAAQRSASIYLSLCVTLAKATLKACSAENGY